MKLLPLKNNVMFTFIESTGGTKGRFHELIRSSGIYVPPTVAAQKVARWAVVVAAGPDATVEPGDYILIESLMWMEGVKYEGVEGGKIWKTDDQKILAVTNDINDCQSQAF
jgi:hypothetical protein